MAEKPDITHWLFGRQDLLATNPALWVDRIASSLHWLKSADVSQSTKTMDRVLSSPEVCKAGIPQHKLNSLHKAGWITGIPGNLPSPPKPGVVGLSVDETNAFVVPLQISDSGSWNVDHRLPFRAETLQDLFTQMSRHVVIDSFLPERFSFDIDTQLKQYMEGPSMDLAAFVAVLVHAVQQPQNQFDACCVVAEQNATGQIIPSGFVEQKLSAFVREYERGSLLIRPQQCKASAAFDSRFDDIWPLQSIQDLFQKLEESGLVAAFSVRHCMTASDVSVALRRLRDLVYHQHRYRDGLDLAERLEECEFDQSVGFGERQEIMDLQCQLERHLGDPEQAVQTAATLINAVGQLNFAKSYDQTAIAEIAYASSLFDAHRFSEMLETLLPWRDRCQSDPNSLSPLTRVMVQNTFARALIAEGKPGWESLLMASHEIQLEVFPWEVSRTDNYLLFGYLNSGQLDQAEQLIGVPEDWQSYHPMSSWMRCYLRADLARRQGNLWQADWIETGSEPPSGCAHPMAFYLQATARQPGRSPAERSDRFARADRLLGMDIEAAKGRSIESVIQWWLRILAAAMDDDTALLQQRVAELESEIDQVRVERLAFKSRQWLLQFKQEPKIQTISRILDQVILL